MVEVIHRLRLRCVHGGLGERVSLEKGEKTASSLGLAVLSGFGWVDLVLEAVLVAAVTKSALLWGDGGASPFGLEAIFCLSR